VSANQHRIPDGALRFVITVKICGAVINNHADKFMMFHDAHRICNWSADRNPPLDLGSRLRLLSRKKLSMCATANQAHQNDGKNSHGTMPSNDPELSHAGLAMWTAQRNRPRQPALAPVIC
jgi:hypothetical protein